MSDRTVNRGTTSMRGERPTGRLTCPQCECRLDVFETSSGGRTVSVAVLSTAADPKALQRFMAPDEGPEIVCPACNVKIDPAAPYRRLKSPLKGGAADLRRPSRSDPFA
jgi:hypothetical protein